MDSVLLCVYLFFLCLPLTFAAFLSSNKFPVHWTWGIVILHVAWNTAGFQLYDYYRSITLLFMGNAVPTILSCYIVACLPRIEVSVRIWIRK